VLGDIIIVLLCPRSREQESLLSRPPIHPLVTLQNCLESVFRDPRLLIREAHNFFEFATIEAEIRVFQQLVLHEWRQRPRSRDVRFGEEVRDMVSHVADIERFCTTTA